MVLQDILAQQNAGYQIGRIRLGEYIPAQDGKNGRASKLPGFRLTTASRVVAERAAQVYDGRLSDYRPQRGRPGYAVDTDLRELDVMVMLSGKSISQHYELWSGKGCLRRCDAVTERISGRPCLCPADPAERHGLAKLNPPKACKPHTRISVVLPDLPGLGYWRCDTTSGHAARDNAVIAQFMSVIASRAADPAQYLRGRLLLDQRQSTVDGRVVEYGVAVLQPADSIRAIATGEVAARPFTAALPPAPPTARAITAGQGGGQDDAPPPQPDPADGIADAEVVDAQQYVTLADAACSVQEIQNLADMAAQDGVREDIVTVPGDDGVLVTMALAGYLRRLWYVHNDRAKGL